MSRKNSPLGMLLAVGLTSLGFAACSSETEGGAATGGVATAGVATGGVASGTGGASGGVSSGGTITKTGGTATGGSLATGGVVGTGGSISSGGNVSPTGGAGVTGGTSSGAGAGGTSSSGGSLASGGASGSGTGGGSGTCQKGQTKGADVVIMGESFYAIAPQYIQKRLEDNARKAGSLGASETYRNVAVSGQNMNYIATTEWTAATQGGASVKLVIMDGGGIDCLGGGCSNCASTFTTLLGKMATAGVKDVVYTRYPEPGAPPGSNASLKSCLDQTMPGMQTVCEGSTSPKCHWVDLRPVFVAGDTTDGLHPTQSGGDHVGDLIWSEMTKACLGQ
jgi:hypothetical protein